MKPHLLYLSSMALGLAAAHPALAQSVEIEHAVARVVVIPEARSDVAVEIVPGRADLPALEVTRNGGKVVIDGKLSSRTGLGRASRISRCRSGNVEARQPGEGAEVEVRGHGRVALEDAPLIVLRTPRNVDVATGSGVWGSVGRGARSLELGSAGCGYWTVGNVDGDVELSVAGSGGVRMGSSRSLSVRIGGSGDVVARETGEFEAAIGGSGDIRVMRVDGPIDVKIGGSGDIVLERGRAPSMDVSIAGSGDVRFGGVAERVSAAIAGSGDIYVREVTGEVTRSVVGSGRVHVGD